jgi:hypothetical protein
MIYLVIGLMMKVGIPILIMTMMKFKNKLKLSLVFQAFFFILSTW